MITASDVNTIFAYADVNHPFHMPVVVFLNGYKRQWQYYKKMARSLSQTVPKRQECINKMLDEFNKVMI